MFAEPAAWTTARNARMAAQFPELAVSDPDGVLSTDGFRTAQGQPVTTFSQMAMRLGNHAVQDGSPPDPAPLPDPNGPEANAMPDFGPSMYDGSNAHSPSAQPDAGITPSSVAGGLGEFAGIAGQTAKNFLSSAAPEGANPIEEALLRPANYVFPGSILGNIGADIFGHIARNAADAALPDSMPARGLLTTAAGLVGGAGGYGVGHAAESWMQAAAPKVASYASDVARTATEPGAIPLRPGEAMPRAEIIPGAGGPVEPDARLLPPNGGGVVDRIAGRTGEYAAPGIPATSAVGPDTEEQLLAKAEAEAKAGGVTPETEQELRMWALGKAMGAQPTGEVLAAQDASRAQQSAIARTSAELASSNLEGRIPGTELPATGPVGNPESIPFTNADALPGGEVRAQAMAQAEVPPVPPSATPGMRAANQEALANGITREAGVPPPPTPGDIALDAMNVPRTLATTLSLHGPLRQGVWLWPAHPVAGVQSVADGLRALVGHGDEVQAALDSDRWAALRRQSGVFQAPQPGAGGKLSSGEEQVMSTLLDKLPLVSNSKAWYVTYLNALRVHVFNGVADRWANDPSKSATDYQQLAKMVNVFSGRGSIPDLGKLEPFLNATFFSPKQSAAMFQRPWMLVAPGISNAVRVEVARNIGATIALGAGILAAMKARGITVGVDPRAADFGKYVIGQIHSDFWGGQSQMVRLVSQLVTGQTVSGSGKVNPEDRGKALLTYLQNRFAPGITMLAGDTQGNPGLLSNPAGTLNAVRSGNFSGVKQAAWNSSTPIDIHDIIDGFRTGGAKGALLSSPSILGQSETNYGVPSAVDKYFAADVQTRTAMRQADPTLAAQVSAREQQIGGNIAAQDTINAGKQTDEADAAKLFDPNNPKAFRDQLSNINLQTQAKREQADTDYQRVAAGQTPMPADPQKAALYQYYQALDASRLPGGKLDGDAFDTRLAETEKGWTPAQKAYVQTNTGQSQHDTPLVAQYYKDEQAIRDSGYWDAKKQAFQLVARQAGLPAVDNASQLQDTLTKTFANQYGPQANMAAQSVAGKVDAAVGKMMESWRLAPQHKDTAQLLYKWGLAGGAKEKAALAIPGMQHGGLIDHSTGTITPFEEIPWKTVRKVTRELKRLSDGQLAVDETTEEPDVQRREVKIAHRGTDGKLVGSVVLHQEAVTA